MPYIAAIVPIPCEKGFPYLWRASSLPNVLPNVLIFGWRWLASQPIELQAFAYGKLSLFSQKAWTSRVKG